MRVHVVTLRDLPTLGAFDTAPLADFVRDKEILTFREHLQTATDREIRARARAGGRVMVTLDRGISQILATEGRDSPSVIDLPIDGLTRERSTHVLRKVLDAVRHDLNLDCVATVTAQGIRVRRLPTAR